MTWKILLFLAVVVALGSCRKYETSVKFSQLKENDGWFYLQKFTFLEGVARFDVQLFVTGKANSKSHSLFIQGVPSEDWEKEQEQKCKSPMKMPVLIQQLRMTGQKKIDVFQFSVRKQDNYYFVIKDCMQMYRKDYENEDLTLHIKFHAFSNDVELKDGSDDSQVIEVEEQGISEEIIEGSAEVVQNPIQLKSVKPSEQNKVNNTEQL